MRTLQRTISTIREMTFEELDLIGGAAIATSEPDLSVTTSLVLIREETGAQVSVQMIDDMMVQYIPDWV